MTTVAPTSGRLPRRYRVTLAVLSVCSGLALGLFVVAQPFTPVSAPLLVLGAALGSLVGAAAFRALEHSLE
jgi:hypothetical protein